MLGRQSLRDFIRGESASLREESQSFREFLRGENESLRELIRNQHEETQDLIRDMREDGHRREEEFREFMRESTLRHERIYGPAIVEMEESRKQLRANTEAVLRLLDRFDEPGAATA